MSTTDDGRPASPCKVEEPVNNDLQVGDPVEVCVSPGTFAKDRVTSLILKARQPYFHVFNFDGHFHLCDEHDTWRRDSPSSATQEETTSAVEDKEDTREE